MHNSSIPLESNEKLVNQFIAFRNRNKSQVSRSDRAYSCMLLQFATESTRPLQKCNELDIKDFLQKHCKKEATWNVYLSTLRRFYAWLVNRDGYLPEKKWKTPEFFDLLDWKSAKSWKYGPNDMWSEEEILLAISVLDHPRNKALIAMLYDLAARPVELLALKIKDLALKENFAQVKLIDHSNPEGRVVPITFAFPYLLTWLNSHPLKDADAPLWVRLEGIPKRIGYNALYQLCVVHLKNKLGHRIHKPFNPYCIGDHSRLTNLVESGMTEFELKRFRGWALDSKMAKRYVHMSGKGLNEKLLQLAGIKTPENTTKESPLTPKECYRCKYRNASDAKYCVKCNFILDPATWEEVSKAENKHLERIERLEQQIELIGKWLGNNSGVQVYQRKSPKEDEDKYFVLFTTGYRSVRNNISSNKPCKDHEFCH